MGPQPPPGTKAEAMNSLSSPREEAVVFRLDWGSYELGVGECRELIRFLERRGERSNGDSARAFARRLKALLDSRAGILPGDVTEEELDGIADAARDWLERDGPDLFPERMLLLLDVVRGRRAHD